MNCCTTQRHVLGRLGKVSRAPCCNGIPSVLCHHLPRQRPADLQGIRPIRPADADLPGTALRQPNRPVQGVTVDVEWGEVAPAMGLDCECRAVAEADSEGGSGHGARQGNEQNVLSPILHDIRREFRSVPSAMQQDSEETVLFRRVSEYECDYEKSARIQCRKQHFTYVILVVPGLPLKGNGGEGRR